MSDLTFSCPHCEQSLDIPEELLGQTVECPSCNGSIQLPEPEPQPIPDPPVELRTPVQSEPPPKQTKTCQFCGEEILESARKCKHCGEFLDGSSRPAPSASQKKAAGPEKKLWEGHPSGLYYIGHWFFGILFLPVFGLGLLFIIYAILDQKTRVYTHTTRKVISKVGIISRKTHEVAIRDIRSINMNQSILERIFGLGSVQIGSAGTGGVEVEFKGVTKPAMVRDGVRKTKDELDG